MNKWSIIDLIFPHHCLLCAAKTTLPMNLCSDCLPELPWLNNTCTLCSLPIYGDIPENRICGNCLKNPPPVDRMISAFAYEFPIRQMINRFKISQQVHIGTTLGKLAAQAIAGRYLIDGTGNDHHHKLPDLIVPVPLNWRKLQRRGFNQAQLVARTLSRDLGIPLQPDLIKQVQRTEPQKGLSRDERSRNIRGAYQITRELSGQCIALVDDVVTTMATVTEIARLLKSSGAGEVHVWSVARTLPFA